MIFPFVILLILALILEASLTSLPLILLILLVLTIVYRKKEVFFLAFFFGIYFDMLSFKTIGTTSLFLITFLFLVLLYQRKFEIATNNFVLISSFLGSFGFLFVLGYTSSIILESMLGSALGIVLFHVLKKVNFNKV